MAHRIVHNFVKPAVVFLIAACIVGIIIVTIGSTLLRLHPAVFSSEFTRPDLWTAIGIALVILFGGAFLASRPAGSLGPLDREVALGSRPFFAPQPPPLNMAVRRGAPGTLNDIKEGFVLYAQSGPLARVVGVLPGEEEYGRRRRGLIYAHGLYGASDELWIPVEAVLAVYPETGAVFLAAKGDETEHFGWNLPPESFRRDPGRTPEPPSSF